MIGTYVDIIVIDVSFISLTKILRNCFSFLVKNGHLVCLVKPQFEVGRSLINKGGVVKDSNIRRQTVENIIRHGRTLGFRHNGVVNSPIQGKKSGNQEYLISFQKQ